MEEVVINRILNLNNKKAWNFAAEIHLRSKNSIKNVEYLGLNSKQINFFKKINVSNKNICHLCCNAGTELMGVYKMGAFRCVGFDFSKNFIEFARKTSKELNLPCEFYIKDVTNIPKTFDNEFDVVFISVGTFIWFSDLVKLMRVVYRLLKKGGLLYINELHPMLRTLSYDEKNGKLLINKSYFQKRRIVTKKAVTYIEGNYNGIGEQFLYPYTISDVFDAIITAGLNIKMFKEYQEDISIKFKELENKKGFVPMSYDLVAEKRSYST